MQGNNRYFYVKSQKYNLKNWDGCFNVNASGMYRHHSSLKGFKTQSLECDTCGIFFYESDVTLGPSIISYSLKTFLEARVHFSY